MIGSLTRMPAEFNHAELSGKSIFPVIVQNITVKIPSFITDLQFANIADAALRIEGFEHLKRGLLTARIGPQYFPWPPSNEPNRPVYRGLQMLEENDAAILFGRDAAIIKGLDEIRRLRGGAKERALIILGASGAGKSSFLRAGLIAVRNVKTPLYCTACDTARTRSSNRCVRASGKPRSCA